MEPLEQIKLLSGKTDENIISLLVEKSKKEIESYLQQEYLPVFENVMVDMAVVKLNRIGTEGLASQGYSGVSESYIDQYPYYIMKQLDSFKRKVFFL